MRHKSFPLTVLHHSNFFKINEKKIKQKKACWKQIARAEGFGARKQSRSSCEMVWCRARSDREEESSPVYHTHWSSPSCSSVPFPSERIILWWKEVASVGLLNISRLENSSCTFHDARVCFISSSWFLNKALFSFYSFLDAQVNV